MMDSAWVSDSAVREFFIWVPHGLGGRFRLFGFRIRVTVLHLIFNLGGYISIAFGATAANFDSFESY